MTTRLLLAVLCAAVAAGCVLRAPWPDRRAQQRGHELFFEKGCHGCHSLGLVGTPLGPDLSHVGERWSRDDIESWLMDPGSHDPVAQMPKLELTTEEISALASFLLAATPTGEGTPDQLTMP